MRTKLLALGIAAAMFLAPAAMATVPIDSPSHYAAPSAIGPHATSQDAATMTTISIRAGLDRIDKFSAAPEVRRAGDLADGTQTRARMAENARIGAGPGDAFALPFVGASSAGKTKTGLAYNLSA